MEVTLGGDRLGSGNKQKQELHNYNRATFNQEQDWKSTMAPGVLYPFLCIPMTNGDSMDIDLDAFVRTLPTKGPLFGSFKLQADIFSVPMRLYNGILHNNPIDIGLKMKDIHFPKLRLEYGASKLRAAGNESDYTWQVHPTALLKYLGLSGIGLNKENPGTDGIYRKINAVPILGYYDIFKNYYANKQEEYAYVIEPNVSGYKSVIDKIYCNGMEMNSIVPLLHTLEPQIYKIQGSSLSPATIEMTLEGANLDDYGMSLEDWQNSLMIKISKATDKEIIFATGSLWELAQEQAHIQDPDLDYSIIHFTSSTDNTAVNSSKIKLSPFLLSNIDDMRKAILADNTLGSEFIIGYEDWVTDSGDGTGLPYSALFKTYRYKESGVTVDVGTSYNSFTMNGLMVKTYQSDLFNNWIQTDWIEGENGIAALSAVNVSEGTLQIDALNLAEKVYNMLNRVALSGGTYEDWQEAVYTQDAVRKAETPIYEGGMSGEIMFEEVIQTAETQIEGQNGALGQLGGKGTLIGTKGGRNIHIKAREPIFVMGIVSITPRVCYTQGNEWYLTELDSYDDLHKPALDQIGFQDLILEQMAWWDTRCQLVVPGQEGPSYFRHSAGKVVAWSNYMTAVDKAFGEFALEEGKNFMVLARNYSMIGTTLSVGDVTTYIDPAKFNYAFAYAARDAQNFWVQLHSRVITRRVMSAHQIPNL